MKPFPPYRAANPSQVALAAVLALIAGCGGDGGTTTSGPTGATGASGAAITTTTTTRASDVVLITDAEIRSAIRVALGDEPELACRGYMTASYVRRAYGDLAGCVSSVGAGGTARDFEFGPIRPGGPGVRVRVVPHGGPNDGETLTVSLIADDPGWRVDSVRPNTPVGP